MVSVGFVDVILWKDAHQFVRSLGQQPGSGSKPGDAILSFFCEKQNICMEGSLKRSYLFAEKISGQIYFLKWIGDEPLINSQTFRAEKERFTAFSREKIKILLLETTYMYFAAQLIAAPVLHVTWSIESQ